MASFTRCNKVSGVYNSKDQINNFKFRVKLQEISKGLPLPEFERFACSDGAAAGPGVQQGYGEEKDFQWGSWGQEQEKEEQKKESEEQKEEQDAEQKDQHREKQCSKLRACPVPHDDKTDENGVDIMADMTDDSSPAGFSSFLLFSLRWCQGRLTVTPDFNDFSLQPYTLEVNLTSKQNFHYSIQAVTPPAVDERKLAQLLMEKKKLSVKHESLCLLLHGSFLRQPLLCCTVELQQLRGFPDAAGPLRVLCRAAESDVLYGSTQLAHRGSDHCAHLGHVFEISFSPPPEADPELVFEVVSCDRWARQRTEGVCTWSLRAARAGTHELHMRVVRPQYSTSSTSARARITEDMTRFFVGGQRAGAQLCKQHGSKLSALGEYSAPAGWLDAVMRVSVQRASAAGAGDLGQRPPPSGAAGTQLLFSSVHAALQAYRRARDRLQLLAQGQHAAKLEDTGHRHGGSEEQSRERQWEKAKTS